VIEFDQNKIDVRTNNAADAKIFDISGAPFEFSGFPASSGAIIFCLGSL
jgi:hypothetical protein